MGRKLFSKKKGDDIKVYKGRARNYKLEKHKPEKRKKRRKHNFWLRFLIVIVVIGGIVAFALSPFFDVTDIQVEGNSYYSAEEIIKMSEGEIGHNIFFGSNKGGMESNIEESPYIKSANVKMSLPSTLVIEVEERARAAFVQYGDNYIILDKEGVVLAKENKNPQLTQIMKVTVSKVEVGEKLEVEETKNLEESLKLLDMTLSNGLFFKKIAIQQGTIYGYIFDKLVCKGTFDEMQSVIEDGSLAKVLYKLNQEGITHGTISIQKGNYLSFSPL